MRLRDLVAATLAHYTADPALARVEWKSRGHDGVPELDGILVEHGFLAGEAQSVMIERAVDLAVDVPVPRSLTVLGQVG